MSFSVKDVLHTAAYLPEEIDKVLDTENPSFLRFHPVLGYTMRDHMFRDGMLDTVSTYTFEFPGGHRRMINGLDAPCRINTYGDSYTMGAQVNDGETWQEVLAAHLREPIRNYGVGGYGVYEAYNKAMEIEASDLAAEYVVLNIWDDDHMRNLDAARWNRVAWMCRDLPRGGGGKDAYPVHGFPWAHLRYNLETGTFDELPGCCSVPDDLRKLVGKDAYYELFKDDEVVHLYTLAEGGEAPVGRLDELAAAFGLRVDLHDPETRAGDARRLHQMYGMKSSEYIVNKMRDWASANGRKLMVLLSYDVPSYVDYIEKGERFDRYFLDYLEKSGVTYVDFLVEKAREFEKYNLPLQQFLEQFYIARAGAQVFGHYKSYGNFWFAHVLRGPLVEWLDPGPPSYR